MAKFAPEEWNQVFTLLDTALDMSPPERESWLAALAQSRPELHPALRELLAKHASNETHDFLRGMPQFTQVDLAPRKGATLNAGEHIGPYRLLRELGAGGMGSVWLAERADGSFKRVVALKLPHVSWSGQIAEQLARERDILAGLEHPNIARLYDAGVDPTGRPFMAMEYVEGQPIDEFCRERALSIDACLRLVLEVAKAVAYAHTKLVVHRDLKPSNVLVTADGAVRLLDFGIARLIAGDAARETARSSVHALTPDYASPEQIKGETAGTETDVYSLAVLTYELLAGARPYKLKHGSRAELEEAITLADPMPASAAAMGKQRARALRGDLDAILKLALEKDPRRRYATVDAFAQDIERYLRNEPIRARPDSTAYRLRKFVVRHKAGTLATSAVVVALLTGAGVAFWQAGVARREAERNAIERDIARRAAGREEAVRLYLTRLFRASVTSNGKEPTDAKVMLDRSAKRLVEEYRDDPYLAGKVVETLADLYGALNDIQGQTALLEGFLAQAGDKAAADSIALARQKLANAEIARGNMTHAAQLLAPAEAFWERDPSRYAEERLEGLVVRTRLLRAQGDLAGAIETGDRAIQERVALSGRNHTETAILYNSQAIALAAANRWDAALDAYAQSLAIYDALGHSGELDALVIRANRGTLSYRYGRLAEAESNLRDAYQKQQALGGASPAVAAAMGLYGATQSALGRHTNALEVLNRAVSMAAEHTGPASPLTLQNRVLLSDALAASGDHAQAARLTQETREVARQQLGEGHPFLQTLTLAEVRHAVAAGRLDTAAAQLPMLIDRFRALGPPARLSLAQALLAQGNVLLARHRAAEALTPLREAEQIRTTLLWPQSWELAEVRERLGEALVESGDASGRALIEAAMTTLQQQLGASHPQVSRASQALAH